jgi:hypothetical protein
LARPVRLAAGLQRKVRRDPQSAQRELKYGLRPPQHVWQYCGASDHRAKRYFFLLWVLCASLRTLR